MTFFRDHSKSCVYAKIVVNLKRKNSTFFRLMVILNLCSTMTVRALRKEQVNNLITNILLFGESRIIFFCIFAPLKVNNLFQRGRAVPSFYTNYRC